MNYIYLLTQLFIYQNYLKYREHVAVDKDLKEVYYLYKALDNIMEHTKRDISVEEYSLWVLANLGNQYDIFLKLLKEQTVHEDTITDVLHTLHERGIAHKIAEEALKISEGKSSIDSLYPLIEQLETHKEQNKSIFVSNNIKEILNDYHKHPGLRWRLDSLNRSLGSLRKGDFGFVFARPETGKTTFLASEITHFATQVDAQSPIIWFNNEQEGRKIPLRLAQSALCLRNEQLNEFADEYTNIYGNKILVYDSANIHKKEVVAICKDINPSCLVFDQLDKIKGFNDDREDLRLGSIYIWARELAKEFAPVIGVCQADGSAEGKKYLNMDNVANAKTAKQAEADWILGIGKSNDPGFEMIRHFSICKNKLFGDPDSDPKMRHGKWDVLIQPEIARYRDI